MDASWKRTHQEQGRANGSRANDPKKNTAQQKRPAPFSSGLASFMAGVEPETKPMAAHQLKRETMRRPMVGKRTLRPQPVYGMGSTRARQAHVDCGAIAAHQMSMLFVSNSPFRGRRKTKDLQARNHNPWQRARPQGTRRETSSAASLGTQGRLDLPSSALDGRVPSLGLRCVGSLGSLGCVHPTSPNLIVGRDGAAF